jgi:hypothetical protein
MAKLNRERKVLEKRQEKQARKDLRKQAAAEPAVAYADSDLVPEESDRTEPPGEPESL